MRRKQAARRREMARIRYLAFMCADAAKIAAFYVRYFGLTELGRSKEGDISLTDGFANLTFFQFRAELGEPRMEVGLHHLGLEVDDLEAVKERYLKFNPGGCIVPEDGGIHRGELRIYDPECNPVSLSTTGFGIKNPVERLPRMRHIAFNALYVEGIRNFYVEVFGFREVRTTSQWRRRGEPNRFLGDGNSNLAIHPFYTSNFGHEARYGVNHFGFLLGETENFVAELKKAVPVAPRPDRPYEDYRARDPEGNGIDLCHSKGLEVDLDKWDLVA
jgi:catechol 2,3-dioxygenase-like lactoylglutathione lyase family enzyme